MIETDNHPRRSTSALISLLRWFDSEAGIESIADNEDNKVDWFRVLPLIGQHAGCLLVFWVGWSPTAVIIAIALYLLRMFAITGFYHRYFSHKSFKTNRFWQFLFAAVGNTAVQRGPLWWAAHHRHHHRFADRVNDVHSPKHHGFWWSHMGWLTSKANFRTRTKYVKEWARFPELRWINRFDTVIPMVFAGLLFFAGGLMERYAPSLGTSGPQLLIWGFFVSTTVLLHATFTINSLDHMIGTRRYNTDDTSRNNWVLAVLTLGEGWHNNHHYYAVSSRQGFMWWELDITYYLLVLMSWLGIVRDLRPVPDRILSA
jgi:stearoyl-CoA desaturase (delta-9 desaturase)